jgi:hypothetical protein
MLRQALQQALRAAIEAESLAEWKEPGSRVREEATQAAARAWAHAANLSVKIYGKG